MAKKKPAKKNKSSEQKSPAQKPLAKRIGTVLLKCLMWFFIVTVGLTLLYRFVPVYYTPLMFIRLIEQAADNKPLRLERDWTSLDNISVHLPNAVITSEDNLFREHNGFDIKGIQQAVKDNQRKNSKRMRGGSTISQQTAKNVFLFPSRTWFRKGMEVYFTVLIELLWSKERIMEVYLNVIEMGNGIYGAEAAAQSYFHKPAARLTKSEAALIAVCLPNPRRFSPVNPSAYIQKRKTTILKLMPNLGEKWSFPIKKAQP